MRLLQAMIVLAVAGALPATAQSPHPPPDFFAGEYVVIGRKPGSAVTYTGRVRLRPRGSGLELTRTVRGRTSRGTATFTAITADRIPVLRLRFVLDGKPCDGLYQWQPDAGNYARLTGQFDYAGKPVRVGRSPGMEALFPLQ